MGRGAGEDRASADRRPQLGQLVGIGGGLRHVELDVARGDDARRPELAITFGMSGRLREAEIEAAQQGGDRGRNAPPAIEGALGDAAVDQDQGNAPLGVRHDQVRPQIGLDEEREIGLPMIEEAFDETRRVEDHKLVDHALGQALLGEIGRRHGARRAQHCQTFLADALDQRDHRDEFADAGAVYPHQRAQWTRDIAFAVAFVKTRGELLAAFQSMRHEHRRKRGSRRREQAIRVQRQRQTLSHGWRAPAAHRQARRRARSPH